MFKGRVGVDGVMGRYLAASALLLCLDAPWQVGLAVRVENVVVNFRVDVFRVDQ